MTWLTPILVPLVLMLIAKVFPYKASQYMAGADISTLKNKYQKWEYLGLPLFFVLIPLMTWLFAELFYHLNNLFQSRNHNMVFILKPDLIMWCVPGALLAFALVIFPMNYIYLFFLGDDYGEYLHFTNLKHGYDGIKIFKPIAFVFGIMAVIMTILMSDYRIVISNRQISLNDLMALRDKAYLYSQVKSVSMVKYTNDKNNERSPNLHYYIRFTDNNYWSTLSGLNDNDQQSNILKFIEKRTALKQDTLDIDPE